MQAFALETNRIPTLRKICWNLGSHFQQSSDQVISVFYFPFHHQPAVLSSRMVYSSTMLVLQVFSKYVFIPICIYSFHQFASVENCISSSHLTNVEKDTREQIIYWCLNKFVIKTSANELYTNISVSVIYSSWI